MSINGVQAVFATTEALTGLAPEHSTSASAEAMPPKPSSNDILKNLPQARQLQVDASFGQANLIIYRILDKQTGRLRQLTLSGDARLSDWSPPLRPAY